MATSSNVASALKVVLPARKTNEKGVALTATFNPANSSTVLTAPTYRDHLTDIYATRIAQDSRELIKNLMQNDPDMSAAMNAFLTVADTWPIMVAKDGEGVIDRVGQKTLMQLITQMTTRTDYSKGFKVVNSLTAISEACRYMILMRGGVSGELVLNKLLLPSEIRMVDLASIEWFELAPGQFTPSQKTPDGKSVSLDFPTFFATWFRQDPTTIYSQSYFVSTINSIAARQQVINDLYRIMQLTGYPRMEVTVMEEVLVKNAPLGSIDTPEKKQQYLTQQISGINAAIANIRPDQTFTHTDSVEVTMLNDKMPAMSIDISNVIEVLNAQNQAGLKTMATIIGRGTSGVNTASVEARIFALNAQALNEPVADFLSQIFTLALRLSGSESYVEVRFQEVELRSDLELQTQLVVKATRLRTDLSDGLITDDEYHLQMYGRLAPDGAPQLSGTGFATATAEVATDDLSPNDDPLGRSVSSGDSGKGAKDNRTQKGQSKQPAKKTPATVK